MKKSKEIILSSVFLTAVSGALQAQEVQVSANDGPDPTDTAHYRSNHHSHTGHSRFYNFFHGGNHAAFGGTNDPGHPYRPEPTTGNNTAGSTPVKNGFGNSMRTSGHS